MNVNVTLMAFWNLYGCLISLYMLGNTEWPPHGDMRSPNDRGRVSQLLGNR